LIGREIKRAVCGGYEKASLEARKGIERVGLIFDSGKDLVL